jgi:hypothetical protein
LKISDGYYQNYHFSSLFSYSLDPICAPILNPTVQYSNLDTSHPLSIAVGDFNNDTYIDIVVANSGSDNVGVFLGYGNDIFASQVMYPTGLGSAPHMVAVGDFNNDNRLDIAVTNFGTNSIGILLGNGDGNFKNQITIDTTPSHPRCLAIGDFNNDNQVDIVFTSYGTDNINILLEFGNDIFRTKLNLSTGYDSLPYSVAVGDFNKDNELDIAVANYGTDNVGVLLGYGNGSFTLQTIYATGITSHPYSIAISDLNRDTHLDIAVVNSGKHNLGVLFGYGNGSFTLPTLYSIGDNSNPISIAIADFNNDNKLDIAIANNGTDSAGVFWGYGNGTFANQMTYSTGPDSSPYSITVADFNNDSRIDIIVANQQNNNVMIFNGYSYETFATQITYPTSISVSSVGISINPTGDDSNPYAVAIGDFNKDGRQDIAVANYGTNNVGILLGNGDGTFASETTYSTGVDSSPKSVAVGDFNNDSRLDIAVANLLANNVGILLGYGDGTFENQTTYPTGYGSGPTAIAVGDFNNDGRQDLAVANFWTNTVGVLLGNGDGTFAPQKTYSTDVDSNPYSIAVGDFNNDSRLDIAVANLWANNVGVLLGYGDGTFANQTTYPTGDAYNPHWVAIGDFNNDSRPDIAVANLWMNKVGVLLGYGDGTFVSQTTYSTGVYSYPYSVSIGDFNNDGRPDIAVANFGTGNVGVLLGYGDGTFASQTTYQTGYGSGPAGVAVGDFNNDSRPDIAVANAWANNVGVLLGNGDGTFPFLLCNYEIDSHPSSVAVGDFNNDSRLDIAFANSGSDNVGILLGYGDGQFSSHMIYPTGCQSHPNSIILDDFNNDNRLDIVVSNFGTGNVGILLGNGNGTFASQTTYSTDANSQPYSVAVGDFNNDSRLDIAVANLGTNNVGILFGYGDGTFANQTTYSTSDDSYPKAVAIGDFNNDGRLDIIIANFGASNIGVLFGYGDGTFRDQEIFSTGVYSFPQTVAVGDFNNDSNLDIAVGNSQYNEEIILVLLGNGNGNFSNSGKYKTGLLSDPSSVVVGDFNNDSRLDIAVANKGTNNLGIFYGYGNGTFSSQTTYSTENSSDPTSVAVGDFNNDHQTDVVVANYGTSTVGIFLAFSNASFVETTTLSTGSAAHPRAIALGDFTNDGQIDIAVANFGTQNIGILRRYENGSFLMQTAYSADFTFYPESIIVTDFNNDSQLDIAVTNPVADNIGVLLGVENGTFGNYTAYSTGIGSNPQSIAIGDFNNDYRADIVVAHAGTGSVGVLLKADRGGFEVLKSFSTGSFSKPYAVAVGDFDNDGRLDIAVANNGNWNIGFFFGFENGTFLSQSTIFLGKAIYPVWIGVGDFNNDKQLDVVAAVNQAPSPVVVLLGNGNGSFQIKMTYGVAASGYGAIADFNNDDRLDLVLTLLYKNMITILLGYGDGTFGNATTYQTGYGSVAQSVIVDDFNNDSRLDIAVTNTVANNVGILLGNWNGTFALQETYSTGVDSTPNSVAVGDFNNDGRLDIAVANFGADNVGVLLGYGDGTFANQTTYSTGIDSSPNSIAVGDFNNDGRLDIAVAHSQSGNVGILLGHVNGTFFNEITYATGDQSQPVSVAVGDFNNDGRLDITFCDMWRDNIGVLLGYADESFISTEAYSIGYSSQPVSIAVGDFDNDTRLDVVVADRGTNELIILYGSGYGTFSGQSSYSTGNDSYPSSVAVGDFNQDHRLDIVVANSGTNNVGVFLGYGNGTFSNQTTYSTGDFSLPLSLAVGTFDNDTQLDIAVANSGISNVCLLRGYGNGSFMNPLCFPSGFGSSPSAVAFGDLNKDNLGDIVVCNNGYSTIEFLSNVCTCPSKVRKSNAFESNDFFANSSEKLCSSDVFPEQISCY